MVLAEMICFRLVCYPPEGGKRLLPLCKLFFYTHASCGIKRDRSALFGSFSRTGEKEHSPAAGTV